MGLVKGNIDVRGCEGGKDDRGAYVDLTPGVLEGGGLEDMKGWKGNVG